MPIPSFCLNFCLLILVSVDGSCLWPLLLHCSISLIPSTWITRNSSVRQNCIFPSIYFYLYGLMGRYFILWVKIRYYCGLSFCSICSSLGHWDPF